ncbi:hypothetical protein E2C01_013602 [Portunus trituberculatus]|uniref:Uncharacterized protein n=3 Tax=Portuninae TaxID=600346 RepID=A0A5B7DHR9_PORTR|nr:hypothetical protein [Portunus trituberculatus]
MAELGLTPNAALHLKVASRQPAGDSLSLGGAMAAVTSLSASGPTTAPPQQHTAPPPYSPTRRRVPSPALPQIPPNLHPDLLPPPVPLLCFPDAHDASDRES